MGRLLKRPREAADTDAEEALKRLPPRLYVYPEVVDEMARQQQSGLAFYGSCVEPPESTGTCIAPPQPHCPWVQGPWVSARNWGSHPSVRSGGHSVRTRVPR